MFLRLNGLALAATNEELQRLTVGVADGTVAKEQVAAFFRRHVRE
jgi:prophage maintenance system killer protein